MLRCWGAFAAMAGFITFAPFTPWPAMPSIAGFMMRRSFDPAGSCPPRDGAASGGGTSPPPRKDQTEHDDGGSRSAPLVADGRMLRSEEVQARGEESGRDAASRENQARAFRSSQR